jgi:protein TonB
VDEHLKASMQPNATKTGSYITIILEGADTSAGPPKQIRVGGNAQAANLIQKVQPIYPAEAKLNHIQGIVRFTATIGKDGTVKNLDLVMGDPILAAAAREAVQKWIYKPTLLNGDPVVVVTQIDVNFTLLE